MITFLFILELIMTIMLLVAFYYTTKYVFKMLDLLSKHLLEVESKTKENNKLITACISVLEKINNTSKGFISPLKAISNEIDKIKDIHTVIYKVQTNDIVIKNMVEETRNIVKASKTRKTTKSSKTSSKEKSSNSEALKGSQTVNSSNK